MYKTKLQELCHQRLWGLPKYSCMKDGPDHNPRFKASLSVNGVSFVSPNICNSSKEAQSEAAKLAFLHFTSPSPDSSMVSTEPIAGGSKIEETYQSFENHSNALDVKNDSSMPRTEPSAKGPKIEETYQSPEIKSNALGVKDDLQYQYKGQLQNYAQWKVFDLPLYSSKSEGPPHARSFKSTVTVDGHTFESPEFFNTLKEAEHAAAKAALMSLSLDGFQEDDSCFYKNLLQELAQKEGFCLPSYKTIKTGAPHMSIFYSTVEVEGEIFHGKAVKSKKQAEINAAKVAYTVFKERRLSRSGEFNSPGSPADEAPESTPSLDSLIPVDPQQNLNPGGPLVSSPTIKCKEHAKESEDVVVVSAENLSANAKVSSQGFIPSPSSVQNIDNLTGNKNPSSCTESVPSSPKEGPPSSPTLTPRDLSSLSMADTNMGKTTGTRSYLLCNRVRVYPCIPDITFPEGITLLPISDDKWVAVSLEFPNEKGT